MKDTDMKDADTKYPQTVVSSYGFIQVFTSEDILVDGKHFYGTGSSIDGAELETLDEAIELIRDWRRLYKFDYASAVFGAARWFGGTDE